MTLLDMLLMLEMGIITRHEAGMIAATYPQEVQRKWSDVGAAYVRVQTPRVFKDSRAALFESIVSTLSRKYTNSSLPIPSPRHVDYHRPRL